MRGTHSQTLQSHFLGHEEVGRGEREMAYGHSGPRRMLQLPCEMLSLSDPLQKQDRLKPPKECL